jgi:hypothetical protein
LSGTKVRGVGFCKLVSVKSAVQKSAVDGTKKCGRGTQKKVIPHYSITFYEEVILKSIIKIIKSQIKLTVHLYGPLILHRLFFECLVFGSAGQVTTVVFCRRNVTKNALRNAVVRRLKKMLSN